MSGRFTLLRKPVLAPGVCLICRSETNGPFVSANFSIKRFGAIYLCSACLIEMTSLLPGSVLEGEKRDYTEAQRQGAQNTLDIAEDVFNDLQRTFINSLRSRAHAFGALTIQEPEAESADIGDTPEGNIGDGGTDKQDSGPIVSTGRDGVSGDTGDGQLIDLGD